MAEGSDNTRVNFGRLPFRPEPTSQTTCPIVNPLLMANSGQPGHLAIQVGSLIMAEHPGIQHRPLLTGRFATSTRIVPDGNRRNGAGIRSSRTHVYDVCGCTPTDRAHSANFTTTAQTHIRSNTLIHGRVREQFATLTLQTGSRCSVSTPSRRPAISR